MSDFCKQCSISTFGEDFGDLRDLVKPGFLAAVICEGCGYISINSEGECVTQFCIEKGKPGHGVTFTVPEACKCTLYTHPNPDNNIGVQKVSDTCPIHQSEATKDGL